MPPRMMMGISSGGMASHAARTAWPQVALGSLGRFSLPATTYTMAIRASPMRAPGINPAAKRYPMEVLVATPYSIMMMQGGISTPMAPAEATMAVARGRG